MDLKEKVNVEIAGIPFEVWIRYDSNRQFFQDYLTEKPPLFVIDPSDEDILQMFYAVEKNNEVEGLPRMPQQLSQLENNAVHEALAEKMLDYGILLMHGSALCMDGQAYIFTAKSGTGKSTHARLWRQTFGDRVWMINDDKPMLKISNEAVTVFGTPWDGKHHLSRNASAPLKAICKLERDLQNRIEPMSASDAFTTIFAQGYSSEKHEAMARVLELEKQLLSAVCFYRLGCNMSPEAAMVAWLGINSPA